ncbi:MAG TPA: DMT family transporter [Microbacteriaceae bacterium]|nr:DMT family transporter [Microbacteriaceae bacterium]
MSSQRRLSFSRQELALIGVTAIWGSTFLIVHTAMEYCPPEFFVGVRFVVAGIVASLVFRRDLAGITWRDIGAGGSIGAMIWLGYGLQTVGLQSISSTTSAFITAFYVPLVPLLQWVVFRRRPGLFTSVGVVLAFIGLVLVSGPGADISFNTGTLLTILCTLPVAIEIILISWFAGRINLGRVTVIQLWVAGLASFATMPVLGEQIPAFSWVWVSAAFGLGVASMLIQAVMNWAQRTVSPTRATIIYSAEPVWAGVFGFLAGDRMTALGLLGSASIVSGMLVSELKPTSTPAEENLPA